MESTKNRYHVDLVFSNLFFGINFSYYVSLIKHYVFFQDLFFLQIAASALFFIPFALFSRRYRRVRLTRSDVWRILLVTLLIVYGNMYMVLWGAKYTNPIDASTIATLGPAFTLVAAALLVRRRVSWVQLVGVALSVAGAAILIFDKGILITRGSEAFGNVLVLVSVISVAVNTVIIKPVLVKLGTLTVMGWYYIIGLVITAPFFAKGTFSNYYFALPPNALLEIAYILILGTILPSYLLYRGTEKLTSVHTALYRYIQPVVATLLALARGQERIDRSNIISAILIFTGIILVVAAYESVLLHVRNYFRDRRGIPGPAPEANPLADGTTPAVEIPAGTAASPAESSPAPPHPAKRKRPAPPNGPAK